MGNGLPHTGHGTRDVELAERWVDVRGVRVHILTGGDAREAGTPPLVLLHGGGLGSAHLMYGDCLAPLAAHGPVIAPDWPGYGGSDKPDAPYTTDWHIAFLTDFLDALGIARAHLCGLSMGGGIALGFALAHPERVRQLVLVNSHGFRQAVPCHVLANVVMRLPWLNTLGWWGVRHHRPIMRRSLRAALRYPEAMTEALIGGVRAGAGSRHGARMATLAAQRDRLERLSHGLPRPPPRVARPNTHPP